MQITKEIELYGGPYDGRTITVLPTTRRLPLAYDAHHPQPFADKRRALYVRRVDRMEYAGVVKFGAGRKSGTT